MTIKRLSTRFFIRELETDGHHPLFFLCDDGNKYFLKHRCSMSKQEIVLLCYEVVCTELLNHFNIPTPQIALVEIQKGSFSKSDIIYNRYIKPEIVCFGSKEIENSLFLSELEVISKKKEYNLLLNPLDLISIAVFDLWVDNVDRRPQNLNLLKSTIDNKFQIIAIDHSFCFGGINGIGIFNPNFETSTYNNLFRSELFKSVIKYISKSTRYKVVENFIDKCNDSCKEKIQTVFPQIPEVWKVTPNLSDRIITFLFDPDRLNEVKNQAIKILSEI